MPIHGYPGNVITANPTAPTVSSASGVWTTEQQLLAVNQGNWPGYEYPLANSLRFNSADSANLTRTPSVDGNRATWTWSAWVKRSLLTSRQMMFGIWPAAGRTDSNTITFEFDVNDRIRVAGGLTQWLLTNAVFRDTASWYHVQLTIDTTSATTTDRVIVYVNGVRQTTNAYSAPSQNLLTGWGLNGSPHFIGSLNGASIFLGGYFSEINFIDGQALTPSSFGLNDPETGVWSPKRYTGTYGTNGFYLPMTTEGQWSGYFDGTGDYVTIANNAALNFGTSAFTVECWFFRTSSATVYGLWSLNSVTSGYAGARAQINTNGSIDVYISQNGSSWANSITNLGSTTVNTWNHLAVVRESNGNIKIYINGTQAGSTVANANSLYAGTSHLIGGVYSAGSPSSVFPGYISNFRSVVGTAVYTGNFTPLTSQLTAITNTQLLTCQSSTFVDNSANALAVTAAGDSRPQQFSPFADAIDDRSGQGNHWIPNNLDLRTTGVGADIMVDVPTSYGTDTGVGGEVRGNYATLNPLNQTGLTFTNGNLNVTGTAPCGTKGTIGVSSGKWYWETVFTATAVVSSGIGLTNASNSTAVGVDTNSWGILSNGNKYYNGSSTSYGSAISLNDVIGIAVDLDAGKVWWSLNGTFQASGNPAAGTNEAFSSISGTIFPMVAAAGTNYTCNYNFGQRAFAYTAPSGFKALCTQNLPTPTIGATSTTQANDYFDATLYTGTDATQSITNSGSMQPDFVWVKARNGAYNHYLYDVIRGSTNALRSSTTGAESQAGDSTLVLQSTGFQVTGTGLGLNSNGTTIVGWQWKGGGTGVSNTAGTITSTVSANTTSGFSIVTYTGTGSNATVGHGLGVAPSMVIVKARNQAYGWWVWHTGLTSAAYAMFLNNTDAQDSYPTVWNSTAPTSNVFSVGTATATNQSTATYVAYCFAPVAGYSAFGRYTGNASADGPFIYTGFRPEFVMIKCSSTTGDWVMQDVARSPYNVSTNYLVANASTAEQTGQLLDFVSNGFKIRVAVSGAMNSSGATYIFMAFAENPFKYSLAR